MTRRNAAILLLSLLIVLAPSLAEARAGGSYRFGGGSSFMSQGSRGFHTYSFNGAAPIQRSLAPRSGSAYGYRPGYGYGYGYRHPFLTGLFGGFFGSWLGGMLFPHWGMGWGFGGMIGSVFSWLILLGLVWFLIRLFAGRGSMMSFGGGSMFGGMPYGPYGGSPMGGGMGFGPQAMFPGNGASRLTTIGVTGADYQEFETILKEVQTAWSRGDLAALRRQVTPEMLSYFAEQLAENQSQGVINHVDDVELIKGEVREAWDEGNLQYATALLHWRARDYTVSAESKPGQGELVVGGDPQHASEASEMWTFARSPGGHWLLSAIQQVS
jgi:predicted lipid-binding transport protein (Tim44 family)